jgi:DNA helicase-2/ATP-dependent DNA helicase PcrA
MLDGRGIHYGILDNKNETKVLTPGVKVVTIHSSKGLEFDTVLIPFLDEGRFPPRDKNNSSDEREDVMNRTRNLLYVAMTRAKSTLYMYTLKGSESPLVAELDKNNMDIQQH